MNNNPIAIDCHNVSKRYLLGEQDSIFTITEYFATKLKKLISSNPEEIPKDEKNVFWALQDVSFTLEKGQVLGLIGRNGSGKSTLLKILSRITPPTTGHFHYNGTIASILEVGTGFKQELTGLDNIFLAGTTLGLSRKEIQKKLDEIIEFAELHKFIDTPVKRYSSGMYVRLAFAVAAHLEPEILLIDEVLAVGDQKFQKKCLKKMNSVAGEGRTVIFVSHNLMAVTQLCQKALLLEDGNLLMDGDVDEVVRHYQDRNRSKAQMSGQFEYAIDANAKAGIKSIAIHSGDNYNLNFDILEKLAFKICIQVNEDFEDLQIQCRIHCLDGQCIFSSREVDGHNFKFKEQRKDVTKEKGEYVIEGKLPSPFLNTGFYEIIFNLTTISDQVVDSKSDIQIEIHDFNSSFSSCVNSLLAPGNIVHPIDWQATQLSQ